MSKKTSFQIVRELCDSSECEILLDTKRSIVRIRFTGKISKIPSIKNNKRIIYRDRRPYVVISENAQNHLAAMDILFHRAQQRANIKRLSFKDIEIFMLVACSSKGRSFDPINMCETICDWLEPSSKMNGNSKSRRGWGVGIIENDSQVTSLAVHQHLIGGDSSVTEITILPFDATKLHLINFIKGIKL